MGINKVIYNGQVLIDLTSSTVTPETLVEGTIAFNSAGEQIVGTLVISGGYTNQVPISINADGTIYNGIGYKNGYRIRSGGEEQAFGGASCTGYIKVKPNDVIRISGFNIKNSSYTANVINISDSEFVNLGQWSANYAGGYGNLAGTAYAKAEAMIEEGNGVYKWVIPPADFCETAYIRVSGVTNGDGSVMIVTVNVEIK